MEIIFILILISLIVAAGFLLAYLWATRTGQFDDSYTPSVRMLFDDELVGNEVHDHVESAQEQNETCNASSTNV
ncbi:MAG: cbb3-type cytochrome oxidase assembly protein CcoS [Saprospiraceae bacterium]